MREEGVEGTFVGYDPGGNGKHGVAMLEVTDGEARRLTLKTCATAEQVLREVEDVGVLAGLGIDTLTCWSTGASGWRPADRWLIQEYPDAIASVVAPNSLYGAMGINGVAVLAALRERWPPLFVTETHPKVLYRALSGRRYRYDHLLADEMDSLLSSQLGLAVETKNDHEWDAAVSALAALRGRAGSWQRDLHALPVAVG